eukprot:383461-Rhodomonas_salina.2
MQPSCLTLSKLQRLSAASSGDGSCQIRDFRVQATKCWDGVALFQSLQRQAAAESHVLPFRAWWYRSFLFKLSQAISGTDQHRTACITWLLSTPSGCAHWRQKWVVPQS